MNQARFGVDSDVCRVKQLTLRAFVANVVLVYAVSDWKQ